MSMRCALLVVLLAVASLSLPARAVAREKLLGFSVKDEVAVIAVDDEALGQFFKVCTFAESGDMSLGWLSPPAGTRCAELNEASAGMPVQQAITGLLGTAKMVKATPWGLKISAEAGDTGTVVVVSGGAEADGGKTVRAPAVASDGALKLGELLFDDSGIVMAAALEAGPKGQRSVVVVNLLPLLTGPAGQRIAAARVKQAEAAMKKRDWTSAKNLLEFAATTDPNSAAIRYARAAAEAQAGVGTTTMLECLRWLKEQATAEDAGPRAKEAQRFLDDAKKDRAFDAWAGEPELRELIGLPAIATMTADARLLERTATFSRQGRTCQTVWLTMTFQKGGKGTLAVAESCKGKKTGTKQPFSWAIDGAKVTMKTAARTVAGEAIPAEASIELDGTYQQLRVTSDSVSAIGPFEPGPALIDDSL